MARMTIGELARQAGVGVETVRYYQRRGLFAEPPRIARTTREYSAEALGLLRFIRRARSLGFNIREVERLVALRRMNKDTRELETMLAAKVVDLEHQMKETQGMIVALDAMAARCETLSAGERWRLFDAEE